MKRFLPLLLVLLLLLSACAPAQGPVENPVDPPNSDSSQNSENNDPNPNPNPDPDPEPDPEPVLNYVHPLTGEKLETPYLGRPVAVMLNNIKQAMPQHGVSQADILYEVLAEGGITRCMGIFSDISAVEKVGSIRSARKYYVQLAQGYNALYVHFGGSPEALNYLKSIKWHEMDGMKGDKCFVQDKDRLKNGYSSEHTWFAVGSGILDYATRLNFTTSYEQEKTYGMTFSETLLVGQPVNKVKVYFNWGSTPSGKATTLTYDESTKNYFAFQSGGNHGSGSDYIDGNTRETISFRNVLVLRAPTSIQSDGKLLTVETTGSGTGYFACNGQMLPIKWSRASVNEPFSFTLENGNPLTFATGKTYIAVVPTAAAVTFE